MPPPPFLDPPGSDGAGRAVPGVTGQSGVPTGLPPVSTSVAALQAGIAAEAAAEPRDVPGPQALADLRGLLAAREALDRLLLQRVGDVEARGLAALDGAATTASWLRQQGTDLPASTVTTARRLVRHQGLAQAVAAGSVSVRDAEQVGRALERARPALDRSDGLVDGQDAQQVLAAVVVDGVLDCLGEAYGGVPDASPHVGTLEELADELSELAWQTQTSQLDRLERALVLLTRHLPPGWLAPSLARLLDALLPSRLEDAAAAAEQERRLTLTPDAEGGGHVRGRLTPEAYELLHTALAAAAETDPARPDDTAAHAEAAEGGSADSVAERLPARSRPQRLHDALVLGLRALLDSGALGVRGKVAPHVGVTVPLGALAGAPGALPAVGGSGQHLPLSLVAAWLQDAWVTRYVLDLRHRVVESSHTERTLKAHERRVKAVETARACQSAGCPRGPDTPAGVRLVPHHVEAWARCGRTSLDDTVLLCEQEHALLHRGAVLTLRDGRRLRAQGWCPPAAG